MRWDIFCTVVDNLGDIGVCWRLGRHLAAEEGAEVCLWVDDLVTFRRLAPVLDPALESQWLGDLEVRHWTRPFPETGVADVVVETFGCDLPASYVETMKAGPRAPVWINLEYLSAESWVNRYHALPSPQPPLTKYFYFPGFVQGTGGVLMEKNLRQRRDAFQADAAEQARFLESLGMQARGPDELLVSMFCYPQAPTPALFDAWEAAGQPVRVIAFADTPAAQALVAAGLASGGRRGRLSGRIVPFLSQDDYDRVLWSCDWNFVRGEDSFVRAQWAARPFVWQAYAQQGDAHRIKMQSFLARYLGASVMGSSAGLVDLWAAWNGLLPQARIAPAWAVCMATRNGIGGIARQWPVQLEALGGLAGNLARFCSDRV